MGKARFTPPFSPSQLKAVAIIPKLAAFPSIVGSVFIVQHVLRSKERRNRVYHRILLSMSAHDFIYSVKAFVSTWPIPKGTPFVYGAVGTTETCTAAGFWGQLGSLTSIFYNGSLTLFFLLVVHYKMKEKQIETHIEPLLHAVPIVFGWGTAFAGLFLDLYNAFGWTCWINSYPFGCIDNETCERGDNAGIYRWVFFHAELWLIYALTVIAMVMIYRTILMQEKLMDRYNFHVSVITEQPASQSSNSLKEQEHTKDRRKSNQFATQATFYVVVFFFTWFFPMLQTVFSVTRYELYYPLILLSSILSSLQGFSNAVIYMRPRWIQFRRKHPELTRRQTFVELVWKGGHLSSRKSSLLSGFPNQSSGRKKESSQGSKVAAVTVEDAEGSSNRLSMSKPLEPHNPAEEHSNHDEETDSNKNAEDAEDPPNVNESDEGDNEEEYLI